MTPFTPVTKNIAHFTFEDNHLSAAISSAHMQRRPTTSLSVRRNSIISQRRESYVDVRRESISQINNYSHETNADVFTTPESINLLKGFCLSITYGACIGGTGSLIGTVPNLIFKEYLDEHRVNNEINFLKFMAFSLPISVVMILITWVVIGTLWLPKG